MLINSRMSQTESGKSILQNSGILVSGGAVNSFTEIDIEAPLPWYIYFWCFNYVFFLRIEGSVKKRNGEWEKKNSIDGNCG